MVNKLIPGGGRLTSHNDMGCVNRTWVFFDEAMLGLHKESKDVTLTTASMNM